MDFFVKSQRRSNIINVQSLPSCYDVSGFAAECFSGLGASLIDLMEAMNLANTPREAIVDQRLASLWFQWSVYPTGWTLPPVWDEFAGLYQTATGWIRLHTNIPAHRRAALSVLNNPKTREDVASLISSLSGDELEASIVDAGGACAVLRSTEQWALHDHGRTLMDEPLIQWSDPAPLQQPNWPGTLQRPLKGLKILDLTRVLAGPVATRTLAGFGAEVLRIDPPGWDEGAVVPEVTLGKRCATLNLATESGRDCFLDLLSEANIFVHGYRKSALENLGLGATVRQDVNPNLIDVSLNAYGWTGPWADRRGFDSLVQMSCGIADAGMHWANKPGPHPLPVQALDHGTGYLMAIAVLESLTQALKTGKASAARLSLARTALTLQEFEQGTPPDQIFEPAAGHDFCSEVERTPWGAARRLRPALTLDGTQMCWDRASCKFGSNQAEWLD